MERLTVKPCLGIAVFCSSSFRYRAGCLLGHKQNADADAPTLGYREWDQSLREDQETVSAFRLLSASSEAYLGCFLVKDGVRGIHPHWLATIEGSRCPTQRGYGSLRLDGQLQSTSQIALIAVVAPLTIEHQWFAKSTMIVFFNKCVRAYTQHWKITLTCNSSQTRFGEAWLAREKKSLPLTRLHPASREATQKAAVGGLPRLPKRVAA